MVKIERARREDAPGIARVVRAAFAREAVRYGVPELPPMRESAADVEALMSDHVFLKATMDGRLVGTVRGRTQEGVCEVGRLAVEPEFAGRGIGQALMQAIEQQCPATRYVLFTGDRSDGPLHIYRKLGYRETHRERIAEGVELVHMDKSVGQPG